MTERFIRPSCFRDKNPNNYGNNCKIENYAYICSPKKSRGGAVVARWAHNPKVVSSSLTPATRQNSDSNGSLFFYGLDFYLKSWLVVSSPDSHRDNPRYKGKQRSKRVAAITFVRSDLNRPLGNKSCICPGGTNYSCDLPQHLLYLFH